MQKVILKASSWMFIVFLLVTFCVNWGVRYMIEEKRFLERADEKFWQIEQLLEENERNIDLLQEEFSEQCLINAAAAAYVSDYNPDIRMDVDELNKVAELLGVDEIHFFTPDGLLYSGTHPEYYGFTFDSGDQMKYFRPMLNDKTMALCQDIQPNTAEAKLMQYAAVWNESGTEIVQIGVTPSRVLEAQEGMSISDTFLMLASSASEVIIAIDPESYQIIGATDLDYVGGQIRNFGIVPEEIQKANVRYAKMTGLPIFDGNNYVYSIHNTGSFIIAHCYERAEIIESVSMDSALTAIYICVFAIVATIFLMVYLNRKIVRSILIINKKLELIEQGDLSITFAQDSVPEVKALSDHINSMVLSIIKQSHKLSMALDLAQIPTGIIEYNTKTKLLTTTEQVPEILRMTHDEFAEACVDADTLSRKLQEIMDKNTMVEKNVLRINETQTYVKMEQFIEGDSVLMLIMDISKEVIEKELIKHERDTDVLTNLYNRRAFYGKAYKLIAEKHAPFVAICMIDLDNLKVVNDVYGHEVGDVYIKQIAELIRFNGDFIAGRLGGDEFVALLYNEQDEQELRVKIQAFIEQQDKHSIEMENGTKVPLSFSVGYAVAPMDSTDYIELIKIADSRMYENKCIRKGGTANVRHTH